MKKVSKVFNKKAEHFREHLNWDYQPALPSQPGEHGLPEEFAITVNFRSICGGIDDSQPVALYDGKLGVSPEFVNNHQAPVGQLQWKDNLQLRYQNPGNVSDRRWSTGALISRDLFLTAAHALEPDPNPKWTVPRIDGSDQPIGPEEIARNMQVNFNFQVDVRGNLRRERSFPVIEMLEYRRNGFDFAVLRLEGRPGDEFGFARISERDAIEGEMLCIIQHPEGLPKRIDAGPLFHIHGDKMGYDTIDTMGGSSGAGIISGLSGMLVGIHTNGGCDDKAIGHNHGLRIGAIVKNSPILSSILRSNWKYQDLGAVTEAPKTGGELSALLDTENKRFYLFYFSRSKVVQQLQLREKWRHERLLTGLDFPRPAGPLTAVFWAAGYACFFADRTDKYIN